MSVEKLKNRISKYKDTTKQTFKSLMYLLENGEFQSENNNTQLSDAEVNTAVSNKPEIAALDPQTATIADIVNALQA